MTDFEASLRTQLHHAAAHQRVPGGYLQTIERRSVERRRQATVLRAVAAIVVVAAAAATILTIADDRQAPPVASVPPDVTSLEPGWHTMTTAPISHRTQHLALAMDDSVLVLGGREASEPSSPLHDGAIYQARSGRWNEVAEAPIPLGEGVTAVWTGTEAIVFSHDPERQNTLTAARYDPVADRWTAVADPPITGSAAPLDSAAWTGHDVVISSTTGATDQRMALFDPDTGRWRNASPPPGGAFSAATWTGTELIGLGRSNDPADGQELGGRRNVILAYDPGSDSWQTQGWGLDGPARSEAVVVWLDDQLFVGGGSTDGNVLNDAALLDPRTDTWTPAPAAPAPFESFTGSTGLWTGSAILVLNTGADRNGPPINFDPASRRWTTGPAAPRSGAQAEGPVVWAADRAVLPLGGLPRTIDGGLHCCPTGLAGGQTYVPPTR